MNKSYIDLVSSFVTTIKVKEKSKMSLSTLSKIYYINFETIHNFEVHLNQNFIMQIQMLPKINVVN